jgi:hypothetical protein
VYRWRFRQGEQPGIDNILKVRIVPIEVVALRSQFVGLWIEQGESTIGAAYVCNEPGGA